MPRPPSDPQAGARAGENRGQLFRDSGSALHDHRVDPAATLGVPRPEGRGCYPLVSLLQRRPTRVLFLEQPVTVCEGEAGRIRGGASGGATVCFGAPPCTNPTPALPQCHLELRPRSAVALARPMPLGG